MSTRRDGPPPPAANPAPPAAEAESPPLSSLPPPPPGLLTEIPMLTGSVVGRELRIPIDLSSPVAVVGGVARTQALVGNGLYRDVLIARVDTQSFSTLSATCTHEGCLVSRFAAPLYECPCHGSRYDLLGAVVRGPAPAALPQLAATYAQGFLRINL